MITNNYNGQHLSYTQIDCMLSCPRKYCFRYIQRLPAPVGSALLLGRAYHKALEVNFQEKVRTGTDVGMPVLLDAFDSEWNRMLQHEEIQWDDESPAEIKDMGRRLVGIYMESVAPFVMPAEVERKFSIALPGLDGYTLDGVIDLITDQGVIIDHKTSSKSKSESDVAKDLQASAYAAAMLADPTLSEVWIEFHTAVKAKTPNIQRLATMRNRQDAEWFIQLASEVLQQIKAGIFPPNPNSYLCSPRWCGYWERCKGGAR